MLIDVLETMYRADAQWLNQGVSNPFRASRAGHCNRALALDKLGIKGEPLLPRRMAVFKHGNIIHDAVTADLSRAFGPKFIPGHVFGDKYVEIEGAKVSLHVDGAIIHDEEEKQKYQADMGLMELKSMADYSFDRARKGEIDKEYLCQAWVYFLNGRYNPIIFVAYRKETASYVEIVFNRLANEKIVIQKFNGDPIELFRNEPVLLAEVHTPFDLTVEEEVRAKYRALMAVKRIEDLPEGVNKIEPETVNVQGKAKAEELKPKYGEPVQNGSWYKFTTGRKLIGFPCSYCKFLRGAPYPYSCYPHTTLELDGDRPKWIVSDK